MKRTWVNLMLAISLISLIGCDDDEEVAEVAREGARLQAEQNVEMSQLNREVAEAHRDVISLQHDLEEQQAGINSERDRLENERREIAEQRHRDPVVAEAIRGAALLLGCLAPLALAAYLLYCLRGRDEDREIGELLIEEMTSERPLLLPPPSPDPTDRGSPAITDDGPHKRLPLTDYERSTE